MELELQTPAVFLPLLGKKRHKGARGGRGSGKSHFFAELAIERCFLKKTRAVCVREIQKSLKASVYQLLLDKIDQMGVARYFKPTNDRLLGPNKSSFIFEGMRNHNAETIKSLEDMDIAWVEEAQLLSQTSLDLLRPTIRGQDSEIWYSYNPKSPKDPVDAFFAAKPPKSVLVTANWMHNPWFKNTVLYDEMKYDRRRDRDKYRHIWLGEYLKHSEARVFRHYRIGSIAEIEAAIQLPGVKIAQGADWGFANDPNVMVRLYVDLHRRKIYVTNEVYQIRVEIDHTPMLFDRIPNARAYVTIGDSARPETISYLNRHGYPRIRKARKGKDSVMEGIEFIKNFEVIIHPDCTHTIDEFDNYSYEIDDLTGFVLPSLVDDKNHVIDSIRYALEPFRTPHIGLM